MNKREKERFYRIKEKCKQNLTNIKDLIRFCKDYKKGLGSIGIIMDIFTLNYDDVVFIISNLETIEKEGE